MKDESIIEIAPLFEGKLKERRAEIRKNLVKLSLSQNQEGEEVTSHQIAAEISEEHGVEFRDTDITSALDELVEENFVSHISNTTFRIETPIEFGDFDSQLDPVWDEFKTKLREQSRDVDPEFVNKNCRGAFEDFLYIFFERLSESTESLDELKTDTLLVGDYEDVLSEVIRVNNLKEGDAFRAALIEYLQNPTDLLLEFTETFYTGIVNYNLLSREEQIEFDEIPAAGKKLFLDTNAIIALLCETDDLHPIMKEVSNRSVELGFDVHYVRETADELDHLISHSGDTISEFTGGPRNLEDNQFINNFVKSEDWRSWGNYEDHIRNWREIISTIYGIEEFETAESDEEVYEFTKNTIRALESDKGVQESDRKKQPALEHDSKLLSSVSELRGESEDEVLTGPFVLSFDSTINTLSTMGKGSFWDQEVVVQPRNWLNYLITFSSAEIDQRGTRSAVAAVLQSAAQFDEQISVDEYVKQVIPKIGADSDVEEVIKQYIIQSPLASELEKSLERGDLRKANKTAEEIFRDEDWAEKFYELNDKSEKLKAARETVEEYQGKYEEEREKRKAYEKALKESDGFLDFSTLLETTNDMNPEELARISDDLNNALSLIDSQLESNWTETELPKPPEHPESVEEVKTWLDEFNFALSNSSQIPSRIKGMNELLADLYLELNELSEE